MWPVLCAIHLNPIVVLPTTLICGNKQTTELHLLVDIAADLFSCGIQCQLKKTALWSSLTSFVVKSFYSMLQLLSKLAFLFFSFTILWDLQRNHQPELLHSFGSVKMMWYKRPQAQPASL